MEEDRVPNPGEPRWAIATSAPASPIWSERGQLVRIEAEIDPDLEMAEIQRRVYAAGGPALYFASVKGCAFPMVSNLFGTIERTRFLFRDTLAAVRHLVELKVDAVGVLEAAVALPRRAGRPAGTPCRSSSDAGRSSTHQTTISQLPQLKCWPRDGGAFITLPQVYTEDADRPGWRHSNLGMYRVQLSGNQYEPDREVGLHYQIHRGIGVHHAAALRRGVPFRVNIFVGGPPALTLAAVMPLPEGHAGAGVRRDAGRPARAAGAAADWPEPNPFLPMPAEADFVHRRHGRSDAAAAGRAVRRPPRLLQPRPRFPGAERRARLPPRRGDLAVHRRRPAAAGGHHASARSSTS